MELYLDNFRGFEKQYIELNDVNFLVGENSTGKTTLLGLLSLINGGEENIWNMDFKNDYVDFGTFNDIISKGRRIKKEYAIGVKVESKDADWFGYDERLIVYSDFEGFPTPSLISMRNENLVCSTKFSEKEIIIYGKEITGANGNWADFHIDDNNILFKKSIDVKSMLRSGELNELRRRPGFAFYHLPKSDDKHIDRFRKAFRPLRDFMFPHDIGIKYNHIWIDPVRSKPKRIYEPQKLKYSAEGEHTPTLLRDILLNNTAKQNKAFITELERFGMASGLFDTIKIDQYRKSKDSPFSLLFKLKNKELKISNVGYGISQVLPILTEVLYAPKESTFLIQQPEVHLHPRSQAYFGEFVYNQLVTQKKKFVIETHSDYLIDRFRLQVRKKNGQVYKKTNILFFETDGQKNKVTKIAIDKNGDYGPDQPQKFREFFLKEEMELLGL